MELYVPGGLISFQMNWVGGKRVWVAGLETIVSFTRILMERICDVE